MGKRNKDIQIDGIGFNVPHWAGKSLEEFMAEAKGEHAEMIPKDVPKKDQDEWLKTAYDLIKKADEGDESFRPTVNTEELKEEAAKAKADKTKDKAAKSTPS